MTRYLLLILTIAVIGLNLAIRGNRVEQRAREYKEARP